MKSWLRRALSLAPALTLIAAFATFGPAQRAAAAPGDLIAEVTTPEGSSLLWTRAISPSVGFDGHYLYYVEYAGSVLHRVDVPPAGASTAATGIYDVPIFGAPSGIMSIAYDRGRDVFWAVGGDGVSIYTLTKGGAATLVFRVDALNDRPGFQVSTYPAEVKLAYDASDDTIWYSPDATTRIYHYLVSPLVTGTRLVPGTPYVDVDMAAECGYSQSSGVAVGGSDLFVSISGCPRYFEFTKTGLKVGSYPMTAVPSAGDLECDDVSYAVSVVWVKDQWSGRIQAYEQPASNACGIGGGASAR